MPSFPAKIKILLILAKTSLKTETTPFPLFHMKIKFSLKYFVNDYLWKYFFASNSPQIPSNLICLTFLVTLNPFTQF